MSSVSFQSVFSSDSAPAINSTGTTTSVVTASSTVSQDVHSFHNESSYDDTDSHESAPALPRPVVSQSLSQRQQVVVDLGHSSHGIQRCWCDLGQNAKYNSLIDGVSCHTGFRLYVSF